jgi:periplasmic divalent cation tolerance protein
LALEKKKNKNSVYSIAILYLVAMVPVEGLHNAVVIISTFPNEKSLRDTAYEVIVSAKSCACVSYTQVRSLYWWESELHDEEEVIALFKTTKMRAKELRSGIEKRHPYDVPEIIEIVAHKTSEPYLDWLIGSTTITLDRKKRRTQHRKA